MKNNLGNRFLFLPINEVILKEYNGYLFKGELRPDLKEYDVMETDRVTYSHLSPNFLQKILMAITLILLFITTLPFIIIWSTFNADEALAMADKYEGIAARLAFVKTKNSISFRKVFKKEYVSNLRFEKMPTTLKNISESNYQVVFYCFRPVTNYETASINKIIEKYHFNDVVFYNQKDIHDFILSKANIRNSKVVIENKDDAFFWKEMQFIDVNPDTSRDQNIILWDRYSSNNFFQSTKIKEYSTFENLIYRETAKSYLARTDIFTDPRDVFFIGHEGDDQVRNYIKNNYDHLKYRFQEKGYRLNLLLIEATKDTSELFLNKILKFIPWADKDQELLNQIERLLKENRVSEQEIENNFLSFLGLPDLKKASFVRYIDLYHSEYHRQFIAFHLNGTSAEIESKIDFYLANIDNHHYGAPAYSMYKGPYDADLFFNFRCEQSIPNEDELEEAGEDKDLLVLIHNTIENIKQQNKSGFIIGLFRELAISIKDTNPNLSNDLIDILNRHTASPKLSRILITKDYRIILTDYNNIEIPMYPLAKIVFLLFINHPEGILFKNMIDYKPELEELYMKVTGRIITPKIKESIIDITDASCNSIAQKVARIRSSFKAYLPEQIADYYSIKGENAEPKFIAINRELVFWENKK